jgi:hypothetical protein
MLHGPQATLQQAAGMRYVHVICSIGMSQHAVLQALQCCPAAKMPQACCQLPVQCTVTLSSLCSATLCHTPEGSV